MKLIEIDKIKKGVKDYWIEQISKISDLNLNFDEYQEYINNYIKYNYELILLINNLPYSYSETASEIVRCKDCKYLYNEDEVGSKRGECWHINGFRTDVEDKDNNFCSWGERKDEHSNQ